MTSDNIERESGRSTTRNARINLRASSRQDELIRRAAETQDKSVTEFVLDSATVAAEHALADRRWYQLSEESWQAFEAALERPVVYKPRLNKSLSEPDIFVD